MVESTKEGVDYLFGLPEGIASSEKFIDQILQEKYIL
jgi:hypothetical protein